MDPFHFQCEASFEEKFCLRRYSERFIVLIKEEFFPRRQADRIQRQVSMSMQMNSLLQVNANEDAHRILCYLREQQNNQNSRKFLHVKK